MSEAEEDLATIVVGEQAPPEPVAAPEDWPLDDVCAAAVDRAREALLEEVDEAQIGEPLGAIAEGPLVVTHYFAGHVPGYTGWRWAVTVTRVPDSDHVTIDETALLPDGDALLAPAWVPWKQRVQSGDLGAGDVLVTEPDDPRLVAGLADNDEPEVDDELRPPQWEPGLGRVRMLSPEGRREAAHRWYREVGPRSSIARAADLQCATCGFLMLIGGPLGQAFGVCANGFSPVDGRIVAMTFGCGAHSETVEKPAVGVAEVIVDEVGYDAMADVEEPEQAEVEEPEQAEVQEPEQAEVEEPGATGEEGTGDEPVVQAGDEQPLPRAGEQPAAEEQEPETDGDRPADEGPPEPGAQPDQGDQSVDMKAEEGA